MHPAIYLYYLYITTVGDSTDSRGTKRPNKDLIFIFCYLFKPVIIIDCLTKIYLPPDIYANNVYSIFFLFFTKEVLDIII